MKKLLFIFFVSCLVAQDLDENLTLEKKSVIILPNQNSDDPNSISRKVTDIVSSKAVELGRFNVIDRTQLEMILSEQKFQLSGMVNENQIVDIGNLAAADEGILVKLINFGQRGVPKKKKKKKKKKEKEPEEETLFEWVIKEGVKAAIHEKQTKIEKYPNNIQTILELEVRLLNIETGVSQNSFLISSSHTGGNKDASLNTVLKDLTIQISRNLRGFYLIASEVIQKNGKKITILTGDDMGLEEGTIFEVSSPDKEKTYKGKMVRIPGASTALVKLINVGTNSSTAEIIRRWDDNVEIGHTVNEMVYDPTATEFGIKTNGVNFSLDAKLWWSPFTKYPVSITGHLGSMRDTRDQDNFFFGIGGELKVDLFEIGKFQTTSAFNFPFNFVSKTDDDNNDASITMFNPGISITSSMILDRKRNLFFTLQYISDFPSSDWQYTMDSENEEEGTTDLVTMDAFWEPGSVIPTLNIAGLYFTIGISILDY